MTQKKPTRRAVAPRRGPAPKKRTGGPARRPGGSRGRGPHGTDPGDPPPGGGGKVKGGPVSR